MKQYLIKQYLRLGVSGILNSCNPMTTIICYQLMNKNRGLFILIMKDFDYLALSGQHLLVFITLHEVGTVTKTAEQLDLTQSTISHSLQKLRLIFDDELFVRSGRSVMPTQKSEYLYQEIKPLLVRLDELTHTQEFEPKLAHFDYTILANDYQVGVFLTQAMQQISAQVASFRLNILPSRKPNIEQLRQHNVDVAFSPFAPDHNDIMSVRLFDDVARCYYDPAYRSPPVTEQDFDNARYVGLSFTKGASASQTDKRIIQAIDANTVIRTNSFATMATFVKGSELMAIVPSKLNTLGFEHLDSVALPYQPTPITMRMLWHKKYQKDPKHQWFREQIVASTDIFRTY